MPQLVLRSKKGERGPDSIEDALKKVVDFAPKAFISALNSAAIYTIGALRLKSLEEMVQKDEAPFDPYLTEIRPWTLKQLY